MNEVEELYLEGKPVMQAIEYKKNYMVACVANDNHLYVIKRDKDKILTKKIFIVTGDNYCLDL
jgi:hypothetical protein